ncbi:MAG: dephospho-CoA kinase [Planctomycetota bacterium]|jgi:dephospho-CoA kinase|nr:MAG: dephospho-CoA kinase [Planctomycetota bacterium]
MIVVGLVGRIGAGKSTVARLLAAHGATVVDADRIAHETLEEADVVQALVARFGPDVLDDAGRVRRAVLAGRVFGPTEAQAADLRALEGIVHPRVRRRIEALVAAARAADSPRVVVLDVPLLVQAGWDTICERLLHVECVEQVRQARIDARGWPAAQRDARERAWERGYRPPDPAKTLRVDASGDPTYTAENVGRIWNVLVGG